MYCTKCGTENPNDMSFCKACGEPLSKGKKPAAPAPEIPKPTPKPTPTPTPAPPKINVVKPRDDTYGSSYGDSSSTRRYGTWDEHSIPSDYQPIGMWGYFGYQILFAIPIIGFILVLIFALGGTSNVNLKNFARSQFCVLILVVIAVIALSSLLAGTGIFNMLRYYYY